MRPLVTRKYRSESMSASATLRAARARDVGPLKRQRRHLLRDVLDVDAQAGRVLPEPAEARIGGGPAILLLAQPRHRPVIDDLAVLVAPRRVTDLADRHALDVAGDDAIDEPRRVRSADAVLEQRRDVDQRGRVADRVVLVLVVRFVCADGVVPRPVAIIQRLAERKRAR